MSYTRSSLAAAEREASDLTAAAQRNGSPYRYRAQRYPNGTDDVASWSWGVAAIETGYGPSREDRFTGFVWKPRS